MDPLGTQLRRQRRKLALSLDDVSRLTGISKPYLSLVETNKTKSPPSDEKLRKLEEALHFPPGSLVVRGHLARTPEDVRLVLQQLLAPPSPPSPSSAPSEEPQADVPASDFRSAFPLSLDRAYLSGALQALVEERVGNAAAVRTTQVPVINKVAAGYPTDFTDLDYPARVADDYIASPPSETDTPDREDRFRFAARVHGASMLPDYREGDIITFSPAAQPRSGDDCFVRLDDGRTTFKRIFFETSPKGEPLIRLQPLNPSFSPKVFPAERVAGLYRAVSVTRPIIAAPSTPTPATVPRE